MPRTRTTKTEALPEPPVLTKASTKETSKKGPSKKDLPKEKEPQLASKTPQTARKKQSTRKKLAVDSNGKNDANQKRSFDEVPDELSSGSPDSKKIKIEQNENESHENELPHMNRQNRVQTNSEKNNHEENSVEENEKEDHKKEDNEREDDKNEEDETNDNEDDIGTPTLAGEILTVRSGSSTAGTSTANVQSSIPTMSIARIRIILGEQRRQFQEMKYVNLIDEVHPGMTRLQFCHQYELGVAQRRHNKHKRAMTRQKNNITE